MFNKKRKKVVKRIQHLASLTGSESRTSVTSPKKLALRHWRYVLLQTRKSLATKEIGILAAGIAYFAMLAFFPMVVALIASTTFVLGNEELHYIVEGIEQYLPSNISTLLTEQLNSTAEHNSRNIVVAVIALALMIYGVSRAGQNLIKAMNIIYEREETRKFLRLRVLSLMFTAALLVIAGVVLSILLIDPSFLIQAGVPSAIAAAFPYLRWVLLAIIITISLASFYRYAPNNSRPHWQWVSWGAGIATVVWLIGTTLFFIYAQYFSNLSDIYDLFAGIIVLMVWFNLSAYIVLLGAEINHRLESRTTRRTTA